MYIALQTFLMLQEKGVNINFLCWGKSVGTTSLEFYPLPLFFCIEADIQNVFKVLSCYKLNFLIIEKKKTNKTAKK